MTQLNEVRMASVSGILGYGFPEASLQAALARKPHMIGVDGGSSDPGPYYLGSGKTLSSPMAMKRDLALLVKGAIGAGIPMMIGTCGGAGGEPHLQVCASLVREIARENGLQFKMALIHSEQDKKFLMEELEGGKIKPLRNGPPLTKESIARAERIVGMMGPEPHRAALEAGAQIILAGRGTDPSPWVALAMHHGMPAAQSWFAGKMLECACNSALPKRHDVLLVTVTPEYVEAEPMNPELRCTPVSVAVQALHENASPVTRYEPGGIADSGECVIAQVSDRVVRITGMRWIPQPYTIKLEGVERVGFSTMTIAGTRDPGLIANYGTVLASVEDASRIKASALGIDPSRYQVIFRSYGKDGVMGVWEPKRDASPHEIGIVAEVVADSQEIASAVLAMVRVTLLHSDFAGRMCKEGNMAFPFSPSDIERGPIYQFSMDHVIAVDDPLLLFPIEYEQV